MKNLNEKQLLYISIAVSVVLALGLLWGLYSKHGLLKDLEAQTLAADDKREGLERNKTSKIPQLKVDLKEMEKLQRTVLNVRLPSINTHEDAYLEMIDHLNEFAEQTEIEVLSVSEENPDDKNRNRKKSKKRKSKVKINWEARYFQYSLSTKFDNAVQFMNRLENYSRLVEIIGLSIESKSGSNGMYNISLRFAVYVFKEPESKVRK